ncbi:helix-turn-helix domain-containing protein [Mucilaginibacter celer]|uniref:Helix-turn-helix domain-containing protein n=1 Tax=Mucilaginibacter celer TaxID=2305508 RepID=A0A494VHQ3_9SPHI|nr:helix-turn-helix transcriptional regulator [Mucilaginibacter celer]AYL94286.1 helix-turn-helix domain-containing protein [Mucilaginibacter celer]
MDDKAKAREARIQFGRKLVLERAYRVMSLEQLAERTGISTSVLSAIEEGTTDFPIDYMLLIFDALDIDGKDFFTDFK